MELSERSEGVEVSVVLPTMNEEATIGTCLDKINRVFEEEGIDGEIIVSDSSEDRTPEIAREKGARIVRPEEGGYGNAYLEGMSRARGRFVVMGDADDTYDFLKIPDLLRPLEEGEADLVIGNRLDGGVKEGAMSFSHRLGQPIMNGLLNLFHRTGISDAHSGFRAITREALERMELKRGGMDFASELVIEADRRGLDWKEVPIELHPRPEESEATYSYFSDSWDHLKLILLRAPSQAFALPGLVLTSLGLSLLLGSLPFGLGLPSVHAVLGSVLTLVGVELFGAGVFVRILNVERGIVDHDALSEFFSRNFTPGRGFWIGVLLFGSGLALASTSGSTGLSLESLALSFTLLGLGIQIGFLSVVWDLVID